LPAVIDRAIGIAQSLIGSRALDLFFAEHGIQGYWTNFDKAEAKMGKSSRSCSLRVDPGAKPDRAVQFKPEGGAMYRLRRLHLTE